MAGEISMAIGVLSGVSTALAIGFSMPKLTESQSNVTLATARAQAEHSYCRSELARVNCYCFAERTRAVLDDANVTQVRNGTYVNRQALARSQAARRCQVYG